jgi:hypothetical protein
MRADQMSTTGKEEPLLAVSIELAAANWKIALHDGQREKPAVHAVAQPQATARLQAVLSLIEQHRQKWSLPRDGQMPSSLILGCSRCPRPFDWRANPYVETTDWRARRRKTAHRVRREGTAIAVSYPYSSSPTGRLLPDGDRRHAT